MSPRAFVLAAPFLALTAGAWAANVGATLLPAAQVSQPWASELDDPRVAAMGGAGSVLAEGSASLQSNPGALDTLVDPELVFAHQELNTDLGLRLEDLSGGRRWGDGALAGEFRYSSLGSFDDRDASGALLGSPTEGGYAGTLGYGQSFWTDTLHAGVALGGSQESLSGQNSSLYTASVGAIYQFYHGFRAGLSLMGVKLSGDGTPDSSQRLGLGWMSGTRDLKVSGEYDRADHGDSALRLGGEWIVAEDYSLRAGWRAPSGDSSTEDAGFSVGAGVQMNGLRLDYAYTPFGVFGGSQRMGATLNLAQGLFGSGKIVIEAAGTSEMAQSDYKDGMDAYARKDWYEAKVSLKNVLKIYPSFDKASEVQGTLAELDKKIAADKAKGNSKDTKTLFSHKLDEARDLLDSGDLAQARNKIQEILGYDPTLKEALDLQKELNGKVQGKINEMKQDADSALENDDLATAVVRYRSVLALDPDDKVAHDRLVRLHPRIADEVSHLHREGIDAYVVGDMEKAIAFWTKALAVDPSDPRNIKNDLARAKKFMEFRTGAKPQ